MQKTGVGDHIIDSDKIYVIFDIKNQKDVSGKDREYVYYKPVASSERDTGLVGSIPIDNFTKAGLRGLLSKKEVGNFLSEISTTTEMEGIDYKGYKEILYANDPVKTLPLLKTLWGKKKAEGESFSRVDREIVEVTMKHIVEELGFVTKTPLLKMRQEIEAELNKATKV